MCKYHDMFNILNIQMDVICVLHMKIHINVFFQIPQVGALARILNIN
jgi:hypothetical protein